MSRYLRKLGLRSHWVLSGTLFSIAFLIAGAIGIKAPTPAWAHIPDYYNSVHFQSGEPDFGTPPRRAIIYWLGELDDRPLNGGEGMYADTDREYVELTEDAYDSRVDRLARRRRRLITQADALAACGDWVWALQACRTLANEQKQTDGSVADRIETLSEARQENLHPGSAAAGEVSEYMHALAIDERCEHARAWQALLAVTRSASTPAFLQPHALYELASVAYELGWCPTAVALYQKLLEQYPHTDKRESALIMVARCALLPKSPTDRNIDAGREALTELSRQDPKTRFARAVQGLKARITYLEGNYNEALEDYLKLDDMTSVEQIRHDLPKNSPLRPYLQAHLLAGYLEELSSANDYNSYENSVEDIERTRASFSTGDARNFSHLLMSDTRLCIPYFYYRLYVCEDQQTDYVRLARLADVIVARHGGLIAVARPANPRFASEVMVRLAEVYYQARRYRDAERWAKMALASGASDRALFVHGAILQKLGRPGPALRQFDLLMTNYPNSPLRRSAREEIAILDEGVNDMGGALDQYFALGYDLDIAFLLDARMTIPQIRLYLAGHSHAGHYNLIAYSLGIRYLRAEKWGAAEYWLRRLPHKVYVSYLKVDSDWFDDTQHTPPPLITAEQLSRLQEAVSKARTANERARALYRYASYYYDHGTLLLYNGALWQGQRAESFSFWWNARQATSRDDNMARAYMYQHEVYARTLALCEAIARQYPNSPTAPQALYRAGCAARKLADLNDWWRAEDSRRHLWTKSVALMQELTRRYPRSDLAHDARKYAKVFAEEKVDPYN